MKLNYKRTVLIGLAFLTISAFWQMYDNVIPLVLKNTFGLGETVTGVIMAADNSENLILFVVGLFVLLICMGTYRSPAVALMPDLTPKPLRSKANAIINLMGAVGGVFTLIMIKLLVGKGDRPNYYPLFTAVGVLMVVGVPVFGNILRARIDYNEPGKTW